MTDTTDYTPPKVWSWAKPSGGAFASINRPIAGPTHDKELPVGRHPLQLYSLGTPNGVKVTILLEELLALGHTGAEYDAWLIKIADGDQFGSGFVGINPNSKIPALVDQSGPQPIRVFDDGLKTYIQFPTNMAATEAPPLFLIGADKQVQLVNYRYLGGYYIVDRLIDVAELRLGEKNQTVVRITRTRDRG